MKFKHVRNYGMLMVAVFLFRTLTFAQDAANLAKQLSNPIASLISVPFQNNTDYGIGELNGTRNTLNIQPVVPLSVSANLNLITRIVAPVVTQYNITGIDSKQSGLSDAVLSGFVSPKETKSGIVWGAGPVFLLPVGTDDYLTTKKFGVGPTAVVLKQNNGFTFGALLNQIWSVAGDKDRQDVNQLFYQPFVSYNWASGAGVTFVMEGTQYWDSNDSNIWISLPVSGVTAIGKQKVQLAFGPRMNVAAPDGGKADWGWRAAIVLLFPKKS
ncbi:MAG TPA: transporter [Bacteroidia bacterium]|nr:transporter [Bacteroidia bacterium]